MAGGARKILLSARNFGFLTKSSIPSSSHSVQLIDGSGGSLKKLTQSFGDLLYHRASTSQFRLYSPRKLVQDFCSKGSRASGAIMSGSVLLGSIYFCSRPVYAMNGLHVLEGDSDVGVSSGTNAEEHVDYISRWHRRIWLALCFYCGVLVHRSNPIAFVVGLFLFLHSTKPTVSSIYLFVDQLRYQLMRDKPFYHIPKILFANKVEVIDCFLFCLAKVEIGDQNLTVVGIFKEWWVLPPLIYFPLILVV